MDQADSEDKDKDDKEGSEGNVASENNESKEGKEGNEEAHEDGRCWKHTIQTKHVKDITSTNFIADSTVTAIDTKDTR